MKKSLAIYFSDNEKMGYPFDEKEYFDIYSEIVGNIENHGIDVWIVRGDSYKGAGIFARGYRFIKNDLVLFDTECRVDLIFNRDHKSTIPKIDDCPVINNFELDQICLDKMKTYELFATISSKTKYVSSFVDCIRCIDNWNCAKDTKIVLKKNFGSAGKGVFVLPFSKIQEDLYDNWSNVIIQEFIDSSVGIQGITDSYHDLRVAVVNGKLTNGFIRIPHSKNLVANIAQGAKSFSVDIDTLPQEAIDLVHKVTKTFDAYYPALYSVDIMNSPDGYKLVEINSRPTVLHPDWSKTYHVFNNAIVDMLVEAVNDNVRQ